MATDNHIGYMEKDPIRGQDSINTFKEILQLAVKNDVSVFGAVSTRRQLTSVRWTLSSSVATSSTTTAHHGTHSIKSWLFYANTV